MDCCNYGYGWEYGGYGYPYYAPTYHYQEYEYQRYNYRTPTYPDYHHHHEQQMLDYGGLGGSGGYVKEPRRRTPRRDAERARARTPAPHMLSVPHAPTPPLDCGVVGRVPPGYCEPQQPWTSGGCQYQMSGGSWSGGWGTRATPLRHLAAMHERCSLSERKTHAPLPSPLPSPLPTPSPRSFYEEYARPRSMASEYVDYAAAPVPDETRPEPAAAPATVPLPAFQQAFGSTEIGRFAEAFTRAEPREESLDFPDWEPPEPAWPRAAKCDNY